MSSHVFFNSRFLQPSLLESALALRGRLPAARVASFLPVVVKYHAQTRVDSSNI
jgi:hypothetical protein